MLMRRTQIYLEPDLADSLDRIALERGVSRAQLIREAARRLVREEPRTEYGSILSLAGIGRDKDGANDVSERHDDYLIEAELETWRS